MNAGTLLTSAGRFLLRFLLTCILFATVAVSTQEAPPAVPIPRDDGPPGDDPLPIWTPPLNTGVENQLVAYNVSTGAVDTDQIVQLESQPEASFTPANPGSMLAGFDNQGGDQPAPEDFGALSRIDNTDDWPWRAHAKLRVTWPSGNTSNCSGGLLDGWHVLTAAHCVYTQIADRCNDPDTKCWAASIRVIPGYDSGEDPFGEANSVMFYTWTAWTADTNYDWDMAMVRLDRPIGALTGWYGYGYNNDDAYFTDNTFDNTGYPGESPYDGEDMYNWEGTFDHVYPHRLYNDDYSYGGQSGGATYNASNIVYGELSHAFVDPDLTGHIRITSDKYTTLGAWISGLTPPASVDLMAADMNVTPAVYDRGDPITGMNYLIYNRSSVNWNSSVDLSVRFSADDFISSADTQISSRNFTGSIDAESARRINAVSPFGSIPDDVCGAWPTWSIYYVGVILDISDADTGNNDSSGRDAARVWINACDAYEYSGGDDDWWLASTINNYGTQLHDIIPAWDVDWVSFTLAEPSVVELWTDGFAGDTRMWLYDDGLEEIEFDDDDGYNYFSYINVLLGAGTYYVKVDEYNNDEKIEDYDLSLMATPAVQMYLPLVRK